MERDEYLKHVGSFGDALRAKLRADRAGLLERLMGQDEADEAQPGDEPGEGERSGDEA